MLSQNSPTTVVVENLVVEGGAASPWVTWVPIIIAFAALLFTTGTFWWLNTRRGRLVANIPRTCAVAVSRQMVLLRLPLTIYNAGARSQVVGDLRCRLPKVKDAQPLPWRTTRTTVRPRTDDFVDFPRSFAVDGRRAASLVVEFGLDDAGFQLDAGVHEVVIESTDGMHNPADGERWEVLASFEWHLHAHAVDGAYIAHAVGQNDNEPKE